MHFKRAVSEGGRQNNEHDMETSIETFKAAMIESIEGLKLEMSSLRTTVLGLTDIMGYIVTSGIVEENEEVCTLNYYQE